ncbi:hypothetical protein ACM26V_07795 [Salipaludibacillus sp. HK11]|uniref:hypothetical protein n=1 Tax=Salipaludibacillus sp. HK11 TaxID=3394320 RepID=UPI0039FC1C01
MRKYIWIFVFLVVGPFSGSLVAQADSDFFADDEFDFEFELNQPQNHDSDYNLNDNSFRTNSTNRTNGANHYNFNSQPDTGGQASLLDTGRDTTTSSQESPLEDPVGWVSQILEGGQSGEDDLSQLLPQDVNEGGDAGLGIDELEPSAQDFVLEESDFEVDVNDTSHQYYRADQIDALLESNSVNILMPEPYTLPVSLEEMMLSFMDELDLSEQMEDSEDEYEDQYFEGALGNEFATMPNQLSVDYNGILISSLDILEAGPGVDPWAGNINEEGLINFWTFFELSENLQAYEETTEIITTLTTHYSEYQTSVEELVAEIEDEMTNEDSSDQ